MWIPAGAGVPPNLQESNITNKKNIIKENLFQASTQDLYIIPIYTLQSYYPSYLSQVEIRMEWNTNTIDLNLYNLLPI